jgi:hypothetical protein
MGYRTAGDFSFDAHVIKLSTHCTKAALDSTKTFAICQLGEGHAQKLIKTCKRANAIIAVISINAPTKFFDWEKAHDLGKYGLAIIHWLHPFVDYLNHRKAYQPS